jgi:hypothetical protein
MAYVKLTEDGKSFIRKVCSGGSNSLLSGRNTSKTKENPNGVLPLFYPTPEAGAVIIWTSHAKHNGKLITTNQELGEALIDWFDKYGKEFQMDANFIAAQSYQESGYKVWNYALTSTASGISQFLVDAIYDIIIKTSSYIDGYVSIKMSDNEIAAITKNLIGNYNDIDNLRVKTALGRQNRPILHQNVIDNPEIMIKAQYRYMKYLANKYGSLASNVLFGYNRGPGYIRQNYSDSIAAARSKKIGYENEGVDYVYKIFKLLDGKFNYTHLNMSAPTSEFNAFNADVASSNKYS